MLFFLLSFFSLCEAREKKSSVLPPARGNARRSAGAQTEVFREGGSVLGALDKRELITWKITVDTRRGGGGGGGGITEFMQDNLCVGIRG